MQLGASQKYNVEISQCGSAYHSIDVYGIGVNDSKIVTKTEHLAMFGFEPKGGPVSIKVTLKSGAAMTASNCELRNKTYKGVTTKFEEGAIIIEVCKPKKQLMVRMLADKGNPLMLMVDPYEERAIAANAKVHTFTSGQIHVQTAKYDRFEVPNDVDVVVIEDGAIVKGTIHTQKNRSKPLTLQGRGIIIPNGAVLSGSSSIPWNSIELPDGKNHNIYDITLIKSRHFSIRVSDDAHIDNIKLFGYNANNDGIVAGKNSLIENSFFKVDDDHIKLYNPNMTVRNCVFYEQSNGGMFQFAWNKVTPGDNCLIENIEVLEWEATCGDPDLNQGGVARTFINHRESDEAGKICANTTFRNIYIQGKLDRFMGLNGTVNPITYKNLKLENITLVEEPYKQSWLYSCKRNGSGGSIDIHFNNVRIANRFIRDTDFKTIGTITLNYDTTGEKYVGKMNPEQADSCACPAPLPIQNITEQSLAKIYPNPCKNILHIESSNPNVRIYNILYQVINVDSKYDGTQHTIHTSGLISGIYFVQIGTSTQKFVIK